MAGSFGRHPRLDVVMGTWCPARLNREVIHGRRVVLSATTIAALIATASCTAVTTPADGAGPGRSSATTGLTVPTTPPPPTSALSLCRQALPSRDVVSGTWTTVRDLRS